MFGRLSRLEDHSRLHRKLLGGCETVTARRRYRIAMDQLRQPEVIDDFSIAPERRSFSRS